MVPILVPDDVLKQLNATRLSLCYEIHGHSGETYNLVTDECVTINAHYNDLTSYLNVIDQIGVRAVDDDGLCRNIQVDIDGCAVSVDGVPLTTNFISGGISIRKISNRGARITVPNCNELSLVMWIMCETHTLEDPFGNGEMVTGDMVTGDMLKFVVMRGLNFGHRLAHGLLGKCMHEYTIMIFTANLLVDRCINFAGQFWNVPVSVEPFAGVDINNNTVPERYVINITSSLTDEKRSYTGWLYELTWSFEKGPCLYVGNRQAGPILKVKDPNDPIIEGVYLHYSVPSLFSEDGFVYGLFEEGNCLRPN